MKAEEEAAIKAKQDARRKKLQAHIDYATKEMLNSSCAINSREPCFITCTHFRKGFVNEWTFAEDLIIEMIPPKCKLWK